MFNSDIEDYGLTVNVTPAAGITAQIFKRYSNGGMTKIENGSIIDPWHDDLDNLLIRCSDGEKECEYVVTVRSALAEGTPKD